MDYDFLQQKMDKYMKSSNNINLDLKDEITKLQYEVSKLIIYKDDHDVLMKQATDALEKEYIGTIDQKENIAKDAV